MAMEVRIVSNTVSRCRTFGKLFAGVLTLVYESLERSRQRRALRGLSDTMLRDIGLSRADVEREASKPLWRD